MPPLDLLPRVESLLAEPAAPATLLRRICELLAREAAHYDWVGCYLSDPVSPRELFLGPFVGEPTEHTRIPFGRGICGQAAESRETFVVLDVTAEANYLSCSSKVRSEIVVPVLLRGEVVGEWDIDSHAPASFTEDDRRLLEALAERTAGLFEQLRKDGPRVTIRLARPDDAGAVAEIYNDAVLHSTATFDTEPKTAEDRREWLATHTGRHPVLVAEAPDGEVVGWTSLTRYSDRCAYDDCAETSFYVAPAWRGRGVGRLLKEALLSEARRLGYHTLLARVTEGNEASLHLNESVGFLSVGTMREVGLKFGRRLDVHLLQIILD